MNKSDVARMLGMGEHEIGDPVEAPGGIVVDSLIDNNRYIIVPEDRPDAEGKTGIMFLAAPAVELGYNGGFPVYANFDSERVGEVAFAEQPKGRKAKGKTEAAEAPEGAPADDAGLPS